jgi:hypothetical protein
MRFELTTSTLAISADLMTPFGKFGNINHNVSRGVACRPVVSPGKWKVGWREAAHIDDVSLPGSPPAPFQPENVGFPWGRLYVMRHVFFPLVLGV